MQPDLFTTDSHHLTQKHEPEVTLLDPQGKCYLCIYRGYYNQSEAQELHCNLLSSIPWRQDNIRIAGRQLPIPRLQAWFGDPGTDYAYSGIRLAPIPLSAALLRIKQDMESLGNGRDQHSLRYNSLLANLYRDGNDSVGWHSDDEKELGTNPVIASVSLGGSRRFSLKPRDKHRPPLHLDLHSGDVLIMGGETQHHWVHQIPKTRTPVTPRINLTFRKIHVK